MAKLQTSAHSLAVLLTVRKKLVEALGTLFGFCSSRTTVTVKKGGHWGRRKDAGYPKCHRSTGFISRARSLSLSPPLPSLPPPLSLPPIYCPSHPFFHCSKFTCVPTVTKIRLNGRGSGVGEGRKEYTILECQHGMIF